MGFREIVIGVALLLALYILWMLFRAARLPRTQVKATPEPLPEYQTILDPGPPSELPLSPVIEPIVPATTREVSSRDASNGGGRESFDALIEIARLRFQIETLEASQAALRQELDTLRGEVEALRNARNVAPQYGEAVVLAQRGLDSSAIAERCGISVSEAELVAALARGVRNEE